MPLSQAMWRRRNTTADAASARLEGLTRARCASQVEANDAYERSGRSTFRTFEEEEEGEVEEEEEEEKDESSSVEEDWVFEEDGKEEDGDGKEGKKAKRRSWVLEAATAELVLSPSDPLGDFMDKIGDSPGPLPAEAVAGGLCIHVTKATLVSLAVRLRARKVP